MALSPAAEAGRGHLRDISPGRHTALARLQRTPLAGTVTTTNATPGTTWPADSQVEGDPPVGREAVEDGHGERGDNRFRRMA